MAGAHHRIALSDVLAYQGTWDRLHAAADALSRQTEELQLWQVNCAKNRIQ
jgi:hypothetical protein